MAAREARKTALRAAAVHASTVMLESQQVVLHSVTLLGESYLKESV
jgi:hypothetical protein